MSVCWLDLYFTFVCFFFLRSQLMKVCEHRTDFIMLMIHTHINVISLIFSLPSFSIYNIDIAASYDDLLMLFWMIDNKTKTAFIACSTYLCFCSFFALSRNFFVVITTQNAFHSALVHNNQLNSFYCDFWLFFLINKINDDNNEWNEIVYGCHSQC